MHFGCLLMTTELFPHANAMHGLFVIKALKSWNTATQLIRSIFFDPFVTVLMGFHSIIIIIIIIIIIQCKEDPTYAVARRDPVKKI